MKRIRTLSISNKHALSERLEKSSWGGFFWNKRFARKQREEMDRHARRQAAMFQAALAAAARPLDDVALPPQEAEPAKVVH